MSVSADMSLPLLRENLLNDKRSVNCRLRTASGWHVSSGTFIGFAGLGYSVGLKRNEKRRHPDVWTSQHSNEIPEKFYVWFRQWAQDGAQEMALSLMKCSLTDTEGTQPQVEYHHSQTIMLIIYHIQ